MSTSGSTAMGGELAVTAWNATTASALTPGAGWTALYDDNTNAAASDYTTAAGPGVVSETESNGSAAGWAGAIATFEPGCTSGSLTVAGPPSVTFGGVTLNGFDTSSTASVQFTADDERAANVGWNISGTSTTLTSGGHTLPTTATTVTSASATAGTGNCSMPTNTVSYPVTLPAAAVAPAGVELYNAASNTGIGPTNVTLNFKTSVPANAYSGAYASTWTISMNSGP